MKAGVLAIAAAMASAVMGKHHDIRGGHKHGGKFHMDRGLELRETPANETCGCTTIYTTITGEGTLYFPPETTTFSSMASPPTPATTSEAASTVVVVPTPFATTCPTPGVYTIPATTVTLTESTTVCGASSTNLPSGGVYTAGGVVTVVETETTVVCPFATTSESNGVVTSTILTTTYVCPSAGTYTIAPLTTTVSASTVWVYPTPASYAPGTYTQEEVVTTITETDYVIFCPFTSPAPVAAQPTAAVVSAPVTGSSEVSTSSEASTGSSSGTLGSPAGKWAITYSPYNDDESCKDSGSVDDDISIIASKGFTAIRVYSTDCNTLSNVGGAASKYGLKLILGVFINDSGCSGAADQITAISQWAQWSIVELIVIGNEAVFSEFTSASNLASFISTSRTTLQQAGYSGPITTTEPLDVWQENASVWCAVVDVVGCNIHPFFNGDVDAGSAGSFVASQLQIVDALCVGKYGVNLETGWPSAGTCNGAACPGTSEQAIAVAGIQQSAGDKSVMFSYTNDYWKAPGAFACEQSWGSIQLFN